MENLLANAGPIGCGIIAFVLLYFNYQKTRKQWDKKPPKQLSHPSIRMALAGLGFAILAFVISAFSSTSITYTLINTAVLEVLFLLLLCRMFVDVNKFHSRKAKS